MRSCNTSSDFLSHRADDKTLRIFLRHNHEPLGKYEMLCHLEYLHVHCLSILNRKVSLFVHIFFSFYVYVTLTNMGNRNLHQIQLLLLPVLKRDLKILWLLYILRNQHFFSQTCLSPVIPLYFFQAYSTVFFIISAIFTLTRRPEGIKFYASVYL